MTFSIRHLIAITTIIALLLGVFIRPIRWFIDIMGQSENLSAFITPFYSIFYILGLENMITWFEPSGNDTITQVLLFVLGSLLSLFTHIILVLVLGSVLNMIYSLIVHGKWPE